MKYNFPKNKLTCKSNVELSDPNFMAKSLKTGMNFIRHQVKMLLWQQKFILHFNFNTESTPETSGLQKIGYFG